MSLAKALHDWRKTQSLAGCGWRFASVVDGEPLCPCPADAAAILALLGERDPFAPDPPAMPDDALWEEFVRRERSVLDVARLTSQVSALVSPELVARSAEPYAQGYINAVNYVIGILAEYDQ